MISVGQDFKWLHPVEKSAIFLSTVDDLDLLGVLPGAATAPYQPLRLPALFRQFSDLRETAEAVREFAAQYGLLGLASLGDPADREFLFAWHERSRWMRWCVSLWDALCDGDAKRGAALTRKPPPPMGYPSDRAKGLLRSAVNSPEEWMQVGMPEDVVQRQLLADVVNSELQLFTTDAIRLEVADYTGELHLATRGGTASLWLVLVWQLAESLAEKKVFQRCQVCNKWFAIEPGVNKVDRVLCSAACKSRAYRMRVARAQELAVAGKKAREIAKDIGSDVETVKKWIAGKKEG